MGNVVKVLIEYAICYIFDILSVKIFKLFCVE